METVLLLIVGLAIAYVIVYTPVGEMFSGSKTPSPVDQKMGKEKIISVPEDSTLKRHFLNNLQVEVESELPPRPTCSMLKRHFDTLVIAEMDERLA